MRETRGAVAAAIAAVEQSVAEAASSEPREPPSHQLHRQTSPALSSTRPVAQNSRRVSPPPPPPPPPLPPLSNDMPNNLEPLPTPRLTRRRVRMSSSATPDSPEHSIHNGWLLAKGDHSSPESSPTSLAPCDPTRALQNEHDPSPPSPHRPPAPCSPEVAQLPPGILPTSPPSAVSPAEPCESRVTLAPSHPEGAVENGVHPAPTLTKEMEVFDLDDNTSACDPKSSSYESTALEKVLEIVEPAKLPASQPPVNTTTAQTIDVAEQTEAAEDLPAQVLSTGPVEEPVERGDKAPQTIGARELSPGIDPPCELPKVTAKPDRPEKTFIHQDAECVPNAVNPSSVGVTAAITLPPPAKPTPTPQAPTHDNNRPLELETLTKLTHPLAIGTTISCPMPEVGPCKYRCIIVETRGRLLAPEKSSNALQYYVHFLGADRRLDIWIAADETRPAIDPDCGKTALLPGYSETALSLEQTTKLSLDGNPGAGVPANGKPQEQRMATNAKPTPSPSAETGKITRRRRRLIQEMNPVSEKELGNEMVEKMEKAREEKTKVKNVSAIRFGSYEMDCWYFSPFPEDFVPTDRLFLCGYCLKYMKLPCTYAKHLRRCEWLHPPGKEIYHDARDNCGPEAVPIKVYEVDGMLNPLYGQNLCLLAKLFLDHKTLHYDVAPFLFYVLTEESPDRPGHFDVVGFFSKEKNVCNSDFNVACILTLPPYQKKGYGKFLIAFSYELSRRENKTGTPERPLSDLGQVSYRSFWIRCILTAVKRSKHSISSASDMAVLTGIREADVVSTLKGLGMLTTWKGEHLITTTFKGVEEALKKSSIGKIAVVSELVRWTPPNTALQVGSPTARRITTRGPQPPTSICGVSGRKPQPSPRCSPRPSPKPSPKATSNGTCRKRPAPSPEALDERGDEPRGATARFSDDQLSQLAQFVVEQGESRVRGIMNTPMGIPREEYEALAGKLQMDFHRVQSKLKRMVNPNKSKRSRHSEQTNPGADSSPKPEDDAMTNEAMSPGQSSDPEELTMDAHTSESDLDDEVQGMVELCRRGDVGKIEAGLNGVLSTIDQFKDGKKIARIAQLLVNKVQRPEEFTEQDGREMSCLLEAARSALAESRQDRKGSESKTIA